MIPTFFELLCYCLQSYSTMLCRY